MFWVGLTCVGFGSVCCTSWESGVAGRVVDDRGSPVAGAHLVYHYEGTSARSLVCGTSYQRQGDLIVTDDAGAFAIPSALHFKTPLDGKLHIVVDAVYAPSLQSGLPERGYLQGPTLRVSAARSPADWYRALEGFAQAVQSADGQGWIGLSKARKRDFLRFVTGEYARFLQEHGQTPRVAGGISWSALAQQMHDHLTAQLNALGK